MINTIRPPVIYDVRSQPRCKVRHHPISERSALSPGKRLRAQSSGGPRSLVLRVVRVDASTARAALGPRSKTGPPRRTAGCSPPGGPVGSETASCSMSCDVGWAILWPCLTCRRSSVQTVPTLATHQTAGAEEPLPARMAGPGGGAGRVRRVTEV
jgi:hypothetical protein